jgi:murein tripeptide amidase MpaA
LPHHISCAFDGGNIEVIDATSLCDIQLNIRWDAGQEHRQWFYFRLSGAAGQPCTLRLMNAGQCSYSPAWQGYQALRSVDRQLWLRVPTTYEGGELIIRDEPPADQVWYAYFAPYPLERLADLLARLQSSPRMRLDRLGPTVDGRDLDRITVGEPAPGRRRLWVTARQHPGETMASWWIEGFLKRLLDPEDARSRALLDRAVLHIIPHMNPDGACRGHLRCNAAGANLNREWESPTQERSPEVLWVRNEMDRTGVDFSLDVHGDEELPYVFLAGAEGIPGWSPRLAALDLAFRDAYERSCPDLQRAQGYPADPPGQANLTMCTAQVSQRYDCLAFTLEMPFKDNAQAPDPQQGWSSGRSMRCGAAAVDAMADVVDRLRP